MKLSSLVGLTAVSLSLAALPALAQDKGHLVEARYFAFVSTSAPKIDSNEFIVEVTDPDIAEKFDRMIHNNLLQPPIAFEAKIASGRKPYNEAWSFHVLPKTLQLIDFATEVCDASPEEIEEHLSEVGGSFLPGSRWCPWSFHISREVRR